MSDRISRKKEKNRKKFARNRVTNYNQSIERPQKWVCVWRHVGLPDRLIAKVGVSVAFGGGGGAVTFISNGLKLNTTQSSSGISFSAGENLCLPGGIYNKYRVIGCDLMVTVSSKATTGPVDILMLPSAETTSPVTSVVQFDQASTFPHSCRRTLGVVGSGKDVEYFKLPFHSMQVLAGIESQLDENYDTDCTSGSSVDPVSLLYVWCVVKPTNGGSFSASTDPVFNVRGSLTVEYFDKAQI